MRTKSIFAALAVLAAIIVALPQSASAGLIGQFLDEDMMPAIVLDDERVSVEQILVIREKLEGIRSEAVAG